MPTLCCCPRRHRGKQISPPEKHTIDRNEAQVCSSDVPFSDLPEINGVVVDHPAGGDIRSRLGRRASAALSAVATGLTQNLSGENASKRQSSIGVGNSQEAIDRRAELRRLRDVRIQQELYSEHASDNASEKSSKNTRYLSSLKNLSFPGRGPRDTIEFTVCQTDMPNEQGQDAAPPGTDNGIRFSSRHSDTPENKYASRSPDSSKAVALSPSISRSASTSESQVSSQDQCEDLSALSTWLAAQEIRTRQSSVRSLEDAEMGEEIYPEQTHNPPTKLDVTNSAMGSPIHSSNNSPKSKNLHIYNVRPSRDLSETSPASEKCQNRCDGESAKDTCWGHRLITESPAEDLARSYATAMAFIDPHNKVSSNYASQITSFQPSPACSRLSLCHLKDAALHSLQLSPFSWEDNSYILCDFGAAEARSSYATAENDRSYRDEEHAEWQAAQHLAEPIRDRPSTSPSGTQSFRQREVELATIQKRFGGVLACKKPKLPLSSRFKEDIGESSDNEKKSVPIIPRIFVTVPWASKSHSGNHEKAIEPSCSSRTEEDCSRNGDQNYGWVSDVNLQSTLHPSPEQAHLGLELKESATDLWQRAIRLEAEQRKEKSLHSRARTSDRSKFSLRPSSQVASLQTQVHKTPSRSSFGPPLLSQSPQSRPWWDVSRFTTRVQQEDTKAMHDLPRPPGKLAMPPESWARFPAHTRETRNGQATANDNVLTKDFAVRTVSSDSQLQWVANQPASAGTCLNQQSASLHARLSQVFKSGLLKLLPLRENVVKRRSNALGRRRASSQLGGEVDYPELEILPPGIGHLLEPEKVAERLPNRKYGSITSQKTFSASPHRVHKHRSSSLSCFQDPISRLDVNQEGPTTTAKPSSEPKTSLYITESEGDFATASEHFVSPLSKTLYLKDGNANKPLAPSLLGTRSEQMLPLYPASPKKDQEAGWQRSSSWGGPSLTSRANPGRHEFRSNGEDEKLPRPLHLYPPPHQGTK